MIIGPSGDEHGTGVTACPFIDRRRAALAQRGINSWLTPGHLPMQPSRSPLRATVLSGVLLVCALVGLYGCHARPPSQAPPGSRTVAQASVPAARLEQRDAAWWLVSPRGEPFFSLGVSVVDRGAARADYDPENPAYASWRHYADDAAWADATAPRLRT